MISWQTYFGVDSISIQSILVCSYTYLLRQQLLSLQPLFRYFQVKKYSINKSLIHVVNVSFVFYDIAQVSIEDKLSLLLTPKFDTISLKKRVQ